MFRLNGIAFIRYAVAIICFVIVLSACAIKHDNAVTMTETELEQIRNAAIGYLEQTDKPDLNEFKTAFIAELKRGAIIRDENTIRIGLWLFEQRDGQPCLIREPNRSALSGSYTVYAFGLFLSKDKGGWSVLNDFQEKQWFKIAE